MTKDLVIIVLGVWVALLPFLGFPNSWDRVILLVSGFSISILMFLLRRDFFSYVERLRRRKDSTRQTDSYVENNVHAEIPDVPKIVPVEDVPSNAEETTVVAEHYVDEKRTKRVRQ